MIAHLIWLHAISFTCYGFIVAYFGCVANFGKWSYNYDMIRIICGGKKNAGASLEIISEYEKRLRKPFNMSWEFVDEDKLISRLEKEWPFSRASEFVIVCDERGKNISSDEYSLLISKAFLEAKEVVVLRGGAYGFSDTIREKADFVWSFSKLVFPHMLFRVMVTEQIYRAQKIHDGGKYHHV